ncbi:VOC family protein [Pseudogulbenkiania subflava]|uniref:Catechol 2,3-dioxygenase n=1 Tax=Pseudogulbenkiania subflava DSM 22618 TaxID=1123014 RepID=A0A1Y6BAS2_9NEIS|nr:VOC family protein [Pseudogulbenkiania subflava]SMF01800.1 Catechol 2,3-dioxygenase [Pseudogulbenkiania subflava DSM 22618]
MMHPNFVILYVDNPAVSAAFYAELFDRQPVEASPTFALFAFESGAKFGLWSKHTVEPTASTGGGGTELAFSVSGDEAVDACHAEWSGRGLEIRQAPVRMDFGYTFVALDPDGHRLRVFAPSAS